MNREFVICILALLVVMIAGGRIVESVFDTPNPNEGMAAPTAVCLVALALSQIVRTMMNLRDAHVRYRQQRNERESRISGGS